jgi:signal transduction histidine kinase
LLRKLRHSLSARLLLLFIATGLAILVVVNITLGLALKHQFERKLRPHIIQYLEYIRQEIDDPPDIERAAALARRVNVDIYIRGPRVNWSSSQSKWDPTSIQYGRPAHKPDRWKPEWKRRHGPRRFAIGEHRDRLVLRTHVGNHTIYFVPDRHSRGPHALLVLLSAMAAVLLVLYLMYRSIRWLFQPIQTIQHTVHRIGEGELDERIDIKRKDELADLSRSINAMADDIGRMLEAKRQLLLSVSHELRSPVTRAKVSAELLPDSTAALAIRTDLREMEVLITEILEVERLDTRHQVLNKAPASIKEMIDEVLLNDFPGAGITAETVPDNDPYVLVDATRIKLLLRNLLANAVKHSDATSKPPQIRAVIENRALRVSVTDFGAGIASEHIPHLTEPFYRVDPARQRSTGGFGLGLYLCHMIAEAHGGSLTIDSKVGEGTTVGVDIPLEGIRTNRCH